ncbi:MAG: glycosyltransferase family 4 protein [Anaerolineales bacterium]|nr:glycosyltransferase family 4 protein [Anaerolineales bacterium]
MTHLHLAYFSPLPPEASGISAYSQQLLKALSQQASLTLFSPQPESVDPSLKQYGSIQALDRYPENRWRYDMALYQMGNSRYHQELYGMALRYGGVVVLHDYGLHHFMYDYTAAEFGLYARELSYAVGAQGWQTAVRILSGESIPPLYELPLNGRLLDSSLGVIVHSEYARRLIQRERPDLPAATIPHLDLLEQRPSRSRREQLGIDPAAPLFLTGGHITSAMQLEMALRAFAQVRQQMPTAHYLLAGGVQPDVLVGELLAAYDLQNAVTLLGYVEDEQVFTEWIATADVVVNLRYPTIGETSGIAMRALAAGRPLLVFDHGWYGELPDDVCLKVPVMDEAALTGAMRRLAQERPLRERLGQAAVYYIQTHHQPAQVAAAYLTFIKQILNVIMGKLQ